MGLVHKDYLTILKFYGINMSGMKKQDIKEKAENILAIKLCKCIKKINPSGVNESKAIAVCTKSIFHKKGIKANGFKCIPKPRLFANNKTKKVLIKLKGKTRKTRKIRKTRK